jgi:tetratricopeptide (TPR) repeat protein
LDGELAEATATLGAIKFWYEWDFPGAAKLLKRAIELNPNYATARQWYAFYLSFTGDQQEAIRQMKIAQELDPLSFILRLAMASIFLNIKKHQEAEAECRGALALDPDNPLVDEMLREVYEAQGDFDRAVECDLKMAKRLLKFSVQDIERLRVIYSTSGWTAYLRVLVELLIPKVEDGYITSHMIAAVYADLGDKDRAFDWMEKGIENRDFGVLWLTIAREFDSLRSDDRYHALLERMGIKRSE